MTTFIWGMTGLDGGGNRWDTGGSLQVSETMTFADVATEAQRQSFLQLTNGKATYGNPGVGCKGPYKTTSMTITRLDPSKTEASDE
jgi:hypothetical protein